MGEITVGIRDRDRVGAFQTDIPTVATRNRSHGPCLTLVIFLQFHLVLLGAGVYDPVISSLALDIWKHAK